MIPTQTDRIAPMEADEVPTEEIQAVDEGATPPATQRGRRRLGVWRRQRVRRATVFATTSALLGTAATVAALVVARSRRRSRRAADRSGNRTVLVSLPFSSIVVSPAPRGARKPVRGRPRSSRSVGRVRRTR